MTAGDDGTLLVVVMVGTHHRPFDRLVRWVDELASTAGPGVRWQVQYGSSTAPTVAQGRDFLDRDEMHAMLEAADVLVCHGGPSTIVEAVRNGLTPVVVPRDPAQGEHIDDHQLRFAAFLAARGTIVQARTAVELGELVDAGLAGRLEAGPDALADPASSAERFGAVVEEMLRTRGESATANRD